MNGSDEHSDHQHWNSSVAERKAYLQSLLKVQEAALQAETRSRTIASLIISGVAIAVAFVVNMNDSWDGKFTGTAASVLVALLLPVISVIASYRKEILATRHLQHAVDSIINAMEYDTENKHEPVLTMEQKMAIQKLLLTEELKYRFSKALKERELTSS